MKSESEIKNEIRLHAKKIGVVLFNSPNVSAETTTGSYVTAGLCRGASDTIGIRSRDGMFVAVEVKSESGLTDHYRQLEQARKKLDRGQPLSKKERHAYEQDMFVDLINNNNG